MIEIIQDVVTITAPITKTDTVLLTTAVPIMIQQEIHVDSEEAILKVLPDGEAREIIILVWTEISPDHREVLTIMGPAADRFADHIRKEILKVEEWIMDGMKETVRMTIIII